MTAAMMSGADEVTREYRYPRSAMIAGYLRAGIGVGLSAGPLFAGGIGTGGVITLGAIAALFGVYGARCAVRQLTRIRLDEDGIVAGGPLPCTLSWSALRDVTLSYYSMRRDAGGGNWMQLNVKCGRRTLRIESSIDGFAEIAARALDEANRRGIELSPTTRDNMRNGSLFPKRPERGS